MCFLKNCAQNNLVNFSLLPEIRVTAIANRFGTPRTSVSVRHDKNPYLTYLPDNFSISWDNLYVNVAAGVQFQQFYLDDCLCALLLVVFVQFRPITRRPVRIN